MEYLKKAPRVRTVDHVIFHNFFVQHQLFF